MASFPGSPLVIDGFLADFEFSCKMPEFLGTEFLGAAVSIVFEYAPE
jgi:hypothetical protein